MHKKEGGRGWGKHQIFKKESNRESCGTGQARGRASVWTVNKRKEGEKGEAGRPLRKGMVGC